MNWFMSFPIVLTQNETASSWIWTWVIDSISSDDNHLRVQRNSLAMYGHKQYS